MEEKKNIPKRIVAIGDSIIQGRVDPENNGFVSMLGKWLVSKDPDKNVVYNLGVGGNTSSDVLARVEVEIPCRTPDLILIHVGLNDLKRMGGRDQNNLVYFDKSRENTENIIASCRKIAEVIWIGLFPINDQKTTPAIWEGEWFFNYDVLKYEEMQRQVCETLGIPYLSLMDKILKIDYLPMIASDGIHLNSKGQSYVFGEVIEMLQKIYS